MTVVEVAWSNENVAKLIEEVHRWAEAGRNAIGCKLWSSDSVGISILVVARARDSDRIQVWRFGEQAKQTFVRQSKNGGDVVEYHGPAAILPGHWFCTRSRCRETRGIPPPPVVFPLSELALEMAENVAMVEAHRRSSTDADAFHEEMGATYYERESRFAQAEIDDLTLVEGISEELRDRLLDKARETLECMMDGMREA